MDPNELARDLWGIRRVIAVSVATLAASAWVLCGVFFEEPDAFLVGVAILTPLLIYGSLTLGALIPWFQKAPALALPPPAAYDEDAEAPKP